MQPASDSLECKEQEVPTQAQMYGTEWAHHQIRAFRGKNEMGYLKIANHDPCRIAAFFVNNSGQIKM